MKKFFILAVFAIAAFVFPGAVKAETTTTALTDLKVLPETVKITNKTYKAGDNVILTAKFKNVSDIKATNVKVRMYFNDVKVYEKTTVSVFKNSTSTVSVPLQLNVNLSGPQKVKVVVDPLNTIAESDEINNEAEVQINVPAASRDLWIERIKPSITNPKVGQKINWLVKVRNTGNAKAINVKVALFAEGNSQYPTAVITIPSIAKNGITQKSFSWTVPADISTAVNFPVLAMVDYDNTTTETNETNNWKSYSLNLKAPDLTATTDPDGFYGKYMYKGLQAGFYFRIANNNVVDVSGVKGAMYYYLGTDAGHPIKLAESGAYNIPKRGNSGQISLAGSLPDSIAVGTPVNFILKADSGNNIPETNEENNTLTFTRTIIERPYQVTPPVFEVTVTDENGNAANGATVSIRNTATGVTETKVTGAETRYNSTGLVIFESRPDTATYELTISKTGYRTITETINYNKNNDESKFKNYGLDTKAMLRGTVKNAAGQPIYGVMVKVEGTGLETMTDSNGKYGFLLNGGSYTLRFVKDNYTRIIEAVNVPALSNMTLDKIMSPATTAYIYGTVTDDMGTPLANVDVKVNDQLLRTTGATGEFPLINSSPGTKKFTFKKAGYVATEFTQEIIAGREYDFSMTLYRPSTDTHVERGATIVSWHQHEGTPANAYFIPEYNVDVWWGLGRVKMGLDYTKTGSSVKLNTLTINNHGLSWECHKVEGEGDIETSAIDIPLTIAAGGCTDKQTQMDVYKVAIYSDNVEVWSDSSFWTSASDPNNTGTRTFSLNNLLVSWNGDFQIKMWVRVQKKAVIGTEGDGAGALVGYHLDKKLITWYPQKPPTTKISTSWSQIGGYLLGILDNPVTAVTSFTDLFTVEQFNQYTMSEVLPQDFPGAPPQY